MDESVTLAVSLIPPQWREKMGIINDPGSSAYCGITLTFLELHTTIYL